MQKVVILLVYEDKIIRNTLSLFYEDLKQYNLHEDLNVYLLKIYEDFTKNECNFFQLEKMPAYLAIICVVSLINTLILNLPEGYTQL